MWLSSRQASERETDALKEQKRVGLETAVVDCDGLCGPGEVDAEPVCQGTLLTLFTLHS